MAQHRSYRSRHCVQRGILVLFLFITFLLDPLTYPFAPCTLQAQGSLQHGYEFTTGVDYSRWIMLDSATTYNYSSLGPALIDLGFDFEFFGMIVNQIYASYRGPLYFNNRFTGEYGSACTFASNEYRNRAPVLLPFGNMMVPPSYTTISTQLLGSPDSHLLVIQYAFTVDWYATSTTNSRSLQVQLNEADGSITFIYGTQNVSETTETQLGLIGTDEKFIVINQQTHTASTVATGDLTGRRWPGAYRYYRFVPLPCRQPQHLQAIAEGTTSARISWRLPYGSNRFQLEYDTAGFTPGTGHSVVVQGHEYLLEGLNPRTTYDFYVRPYCADNSLGEVALLQYSLSCDLTGYNPNRIQYWDLLGENVVCRTGTFNAPDAIIACMDCGPQSSLSRHTIHSDPSETDPRTDSALHTVPPGLCRSVRLGNWLTGSQQESVEYIITVDTNDYDLLILQYAIVEENPNHNSASQPYFTFGIYDTNGVVVDNCHFANFVAGDLSGWHTISGTYGGIVWHDWQAMGLDLTPLHGQTIRVRLSNADCSAGGHFGYGYFTLQSGSKNLRLSSCGDATENTLHAPNGFSYRWYRADNPSLTLSTDDTLHTTVDGHYYCDATYELPGYSCGFTVGAYAGPRYPVAVISPTYLTPCHSRVYFSNNSFVAHDSARTLISTEHCEEYLWDFGDGTTSTFVNPTHQFDPGDYTVRLYAMLAGGQCVDSTQVSIHVEGYSDITYDTMCEGDVRYFHDIRCELLGIYEYRSSMDGCDSVMRLWLHTLPTHTLFYTDTFPLGTSYTFEQDTFFQPGTYHHHYTNVYGCDSLHVLQLSCWEQHDTLLCADALPFEWRGHTFDSASQDTLHLTCIGGTDSIVVLHLDTRPQPIVNLEATPYCKEEGYYLVPLSDTLLYHWAALPPDTHLPTDTFAGSLYPEGLHLSPQEPTTYHITTSYTNTPSCPTSDTLRLYPVRMLPARLEVSPEWLGEGHPTLTALDVGEASQQREWYVNNILQAEVRRRMTYSYQPTDDTVRVALVVHTENCADTAYAQVPVLQYKLWFPNVFTPNKPPNDLFRGYGLNVENYELQVFDRWGNCVFISHDLEEGWDGTYLGTPCQQKAYAYRCTYSTPTDKRLTVMGTVTLVR